MISIVNYGVSNVGSMLNMLRKIGAEAVVVSSPEEILRAEKIILPGIGAFDHGIDALEQMGLIDPLRVRVGDHGVPILGVCLGMQMLGSGSEEGERKGLGLIDGYNRRFKSEGPVRIKVPHMGWNELKILDANTLLEGLDRPRFYFVHSYHFECANPSDALASTTHGIEFTSAIHRGNVWGVQFHPEKSHRFGMTLLRNFAGIPC